MEPTIRINGTAHRIFRLEKFPPSPPLAPYSSSVINIIGIDPRYLWHLVLADCFLGVELARAAPGQPDLVALDGVQTIGQFDRVSQAKATFADGRTKAVQIWFKKHEPDESELVFRQRLLASTTPPAPLPEFFNSIQEAAAFVGRNRKTVSRWIERDWLAVEKLSPNGVKIRIRRTDLEKCASRL